MWLLFCTFMSMHHFLLAVCLVAIQRACEHLERYISSLTKTAGGDIHITRLYAASDFKGKCLVRVRSHVCECVGE